MSSIPREGTIIEGVGDEIVYGFVAVATFLSTVVIYFVTRYEPYQRPQEIHPESAENVANIRERLRQTNYPGRQAIYNNDGTHSCPVCLGSAVNAVETNCGHLFCGQCIITYWEFGHWLGAVRCPVCRQQVTLLLSNFTEQERLDNNPDLQNIQNKINQYNRRFSGEPRPLMDYIRDLPTLLRHAYGEFFSVGGLIWMFRLRVIVCFILALLYFISPLDIIPEAVFGVLGYLDDVFVFLLLAIYISMLYRQFVEARADRANEAHT